MHSAFHILRFLRFKDSISHSANQHPITTIFTFSCNVLFRTYILFIASFFACYFRCSVLPKGHGFQPGTCVLEAFRPSSYPFILAPCLISFMYYMLDHILSIFYVLPPIAPPMGSRMIWCRSSFRTGSFQLSKPSFIVPNEFKFGTLMCHLYELWQQSRETSRPVYADMRLTCLNIQVNSWTYSRSTRAYMHVYMGR